MSHIWQFNGREIDPAKLPHYDEILTCILANGDEDADHRLLTDWDYGPYSSSLTFHERCEGGGAYLLPVQEGILNIYYGGWLNPGSHKLELRRAKLETQEDAWDNMEYYTVFVPYNPPMVHLWEEIAVIAGEMNLHEPED